MTDNEVKNLSEEKLLAIKKARRDIIKTGITTLVIVVVAIFAIMAYNSAAWYANNKDVESTGLGISSEANSDSLFIRHAGEEKNLLNSVSTNWGTEKGLYPISTADCVNWYYVSAWELEKSVQNGVTSNFYYASQYSKATATNGLYTGLGGVERRAYCMSAYNLYTDNGDMDVYLNPVSPIVVDYTATTGKDLRAAIRVALVKDANANGAADAGELLLVYAPVAESGTGYNYISAGKAHAAASTFYAVTGTNTAAVQSVKVGTDGLSDYVAAAADQSYTAGTTSLGTATADGLNILVYVWLEGMDAQAIVGTSDNEQSPLTVTINYVGVAK